MSSAFSRAAPFALQVMTISEPVFSIVNPMGSLEGGAVPSNCKSNAASLVLGPLWWSSTARTLVPLTSKPTLMLVGNRNVSFVPPVMLELRVAEVIEPVGIFIRKISVPLR